MIPQWACQTIATFLTMPCQLQRQSTQNKRLYNAISRIVRRKNLHISGWKHKTNTRMLCEMTWKGNFASVWKNNQLLHAHVYSDTHASTTWTFDSWKCIFISKISSSIVISCHYDNKSTELMGNTTKTHTRTQKSKQRWGCDNWQQVARILREVKAGVWTRTVCILEGKRAHRKSVYELKVTEACWEINTHRWMSVKDICMYMCIGEGIGYSALSACLLIDSSCAFSLKLYFC